ncbi:Hypothetical protein, putative [Bodo saltans]|uniref:Uncharacterized protein n=1 Tax=Bodo saltans TaxID=75058 RepID=A0A0S4JK71_BODSA|nr:Hypothetical protein, putative [Bodo saltans]|eukprot:CUG90785.1 Hypothetical protein, putative [Bodo saltans]
MLAEIPLTLAALVQSVKAKLDRKDLIQCVVLGETLRSSLPSHSEVLGKATAASPSSSAAAAATMTDGVDISLTRILSAIMLRDPQFCLSQGGYCLYPCRPSMMARCAEVNNLFGSTLYPSAGARELPFFQYRRCFGTLAKSSVDNLAVAMQPIVGRQGVMTPGIHTAPSFSSWLDRWEQFLTRAPLRGATMNSLNHQFSLARRMEWNRHFMKPVTNGLITSPISIRSLELLLNYQGITPQRKRMPFREWLQMGLVPEASWSDRSSKELFLAVSQSKAACAELDEQRRSSNGLLHTTRFPSTARSFRQFAPQLYRRETRLASWSDRSSKELFLAVSQSRAACAELDEQRRSSDGLLHATRFPSTARSFRQFAPQLYRRETREGRLLSLRSVTFTSLCYCLHASLNSLGRLHKRKRAEHYSVGLFHFAL